jgi:hypothetical protein
MEAYQLGRPGPAAFGFKYLHRETYLADTWYVRD